MATWKYSVTKYRVSPLPPLTESEFNTLQQAYKKDPIYSLEPKKGFWDEHKIYKYILIAYVIGIPISMIDGDLDVMPWIALALIALWTLSGEAQTMWNYKRFLKDRKAYFEGFKKIIISSKDYADFQNQELSLKRLWM